MNARSSVRRNRVAVTAAAVLALSIALVWAHDESPGSIEAHLHGLVEGGAITEVQHEHIERLYSTNHLSQLTAWLTAQETARQITNDTHLYINALLSLSPADTRPLAPAAAAYTGNGNVTLLGHLDSQPPNPYYGDNSTTGTLYNGIWAYAVGSREYALQSNSFGLHIIDVTDPSAPFQVQFINMSGGASPP
jgi:hypothetical protein